MKTIVFILALAITAFGITGICVPSVLAAIAQHINTPGAFYVAAVIRVCVGLLLISAASASRAPKTLRVLGVFILVAGIATALLGLLAFDCGRAMIDWWLQSGSGFIRLTGLLVLAIGGFLAWTCAPVRRAA